MRAVVFLLIFANLLFFAWAQGYFGPPANPDALRVAQQLNAERVRVVARGDAPPAPPAPAKGADQAVTPDEVTPVVADKAQPSGDACVRVADLSPTDGTRVEALLADGWPAFKARSTAQEGGPGYWVYIPPLANKQDVDNKAAELKRLHVPELFVVQESGAYNRAISLGLFSTREAANARLEALRALGVKSAKVGERGTRTAMVSIEIGGPAAQSDALRQALGAALPDARLADCRPGAAP